jgi:hypothetical protein
MTADVGPHERFVTYEILPLANLAKQRARTRAVVEYDLSIASELTAAHIE